MEKGWVLVILVSILVICISAGQSLDDLVSSAAVRFLGESRAKINWPRHRWHVHHRHRPHLHIPHSHTAAMIKAVKDTAAKAAMKVGVLRALVRALVRCGVPAGFSGDPLPQRCDCPVEKQFINRLAQIWKDPFFCGYLGSLQRPDGVDCVTDGKGNHKCICMKASHADFPPFCCNKAIPPRPMRLLLPCMHGRCRLRTCCERFACTKYACVFCFLFGDESQRCRPCFLEGSKHAITLPPRHCLFLFWLWSAGETVGSVHLVRSCIRACTHAYVCVHESSFRANRTGMLAQAVHHLDDKIRSLHARYGANGPVAPSNFSPPK